MAKRKKEKRMEQIEHAGNMRVDPSLSEVDNPLYSRDHDGDRTNPRRIVAVVNMRESAIVLLQAKGVLDDAQFKAAEHFRRQWERLGGSGAGAMDYSRTVVDGGKSKDPISAVQMEAGRVLKQAEAQLVRAHGVYAYKLVGYICGEGYSIHDMTETRRQRDTMTDMLRMYLDVLADMWGFSTKTKAIGGKRVA